MNLKQLNVETPLPLFYVGQDAEEGPLPTIIYLALSAKESLLTDPFNQPVVQLLRSQTRVFSVDLPFHGPDLDSKTALQQWAHALAQGDDIVSSFLIRLRETIEILLSLNIVKDNVLGIMGLSRGGFLASHTAAVIPEIEALATFAPLTDLASGKDFEFLSLTPIVNNLSLYRLQDALCLKKHRIYMGNRDTRVGTDACYKWVRTLVETAYEKRIRSPHIELILKPSIGHQGHGTHKESFEEGAQWLLRQITR